MTKLQPKSFIVTTTLKNIPIKQLFRSEEVVVFSQDGENDGELYIATNPNSTDVRTSTLSPTITGIIGNNYTDFTDVDNADDELTYESLDSTGIVVGETVTISQGIAFYQTTVKSNTNNIIKLYLIDSEEEFQPAHDDILIFNHSTWYYITSSIDKVAIGDKMMITLDDDASVQYVDVTAKDSTHIGFTISTTNYTSSDVVVFEADLKLDGVGIMLGSNDYPNGLLVKHKTTDSTATNLSILPKSDSSSVTQTHKFFF